MLNGQPVAGRSIPLAATPTASSIRTNSPAFIQVPQFTSVSSIATTLTVASAASIGSNLVDVRNGSMTMGQAVANGMAKGAAVSLILSSTVRSNALQIGLAAGILAGAGYMIDSVMKKSKRDLCRIEDGLEK